MVFFMVRDLVKNRPIPECLKQHPLFFPHLILTPILKIHLPVFCLFACLSVCLFVFQSFQSGCYFILLLTSPRAEHFGLNVLGHRDAVSWPVQT